jgi:hypothetical protein
MQVPVAQWNQAGGNPAGSGFRAVNTVAPASGRAHYIHLPSDPVASSPVIGPNGEIYVGTQAGELYVCRIDRELPLRAPFERKTQIADIAFAVHTPAVAADGTVYCLCTTKPNPRDHRHPPAATNLIVAVNRDGTVRWTTPVPPQEIEGNWSQGFVRGALRVLSHGSTARVIFAADYDLFGSYPNIGGQGPIYVRHLGILDETGAFRLFHRYQEERLFVDAHGGGGFGGTVTVDDLPPLPAGPKLPEGTHPYRDTPIVFGSLPSNEPWTIVVCGRSGIYAFRWSYLDDSFVAQPGLFGTAAASTSPAAFANGLLAATGSNAMALYDTDALALYAQTNILGQETMAAGGLRQIYCLSRGGVLNLVDSNGEVRKRRQLGADTVAFPVLSANHLHVVTMTELRTLTLDLEDVSSIDLQGQSSFPGRSSPAIGPDGSLYLAIGTYLHCYLAPGSSVDAGGLVMG